MTEPNPIFKRGQYLTLTHTVSGCEDDVTCLAVRGPTLLIGSKDKKVRVWNLESGAMAGMITGHDYLVKRVFFGNDTYITASRCELVFVFCVVIIFLNLHVVLRLNSNVVRIWDPSTHMCTGTIKIKHDIEDMAVSADGRWAYCAADKVA